MFVVLFVFPVCTVGLLALFGMFSLRACLCFFMCVSLCGLGLGC